MPKRAIDVHSALIDQGPNILLVRLAGVEVRGQRVAVVPKDLVCVRCSNTDEQRCRGQKRDQGIRRIAVASGCHGLPPVRSALADAWGAGALDWMKHDSRA